MEDKALVLVVICTDVSGVPGVIKRKKKKAGLERNQHLRAEDKKKRNLLRSQWRSRCEITGLEEEGISSGARGHQCHTLPGNQGS